MNEHDPTRSRLAALAAGALAPDQEARVREHLAGCQACTEAFARWRRLTVGLKRLPQPALRMAAVGRMAARAEAHRQEVLERRWNRLVLTGLVSYGWMLFVVVIPLLPTGASWLSDWLGLPWFGVALLSLGLWWSFCWVIGLGLLPLFRARRSYWREQVL